MMNIVRRTDVSFPSGPDTISGTLFIPNTDKPVPALIICHGALDFKENYFELCEYLANKGIASLAIDMHGHGASGGNRFHVNMKDWILDIMRAIDFLEQTQGINDNSIGVFGLSSGGTAVLEAALVDKRIRCIITLDATVKNTLNPVEYLGMKFLGAIGHIKRVLTKDDLRISMIGPFKKVEAASDPEVNRRWKENPKVLKMWSAFPIPGAIPSLIVDTLKRVHLITCPTLVIHGEDDKVDPVKSSQMLFQALTCIKSLHIVPGNGHLGHMDRNKGVVMELTGEWAQTNLI
jgi:alpha-beta hydrolase superfamily lysophospholipase